MTLPVPPLSYSAIHDYKLCPGKYFLLRVDPERRTRAPATADTTGAVPGHVTHKIFEIAMPRVSKPDPQVKEFSKDRLLNNRLLRRVFEEEVDSPTVNFSPDAHEEWARDKEAAFQFMKECRDRLLEALETGEFIKPYMLREYWFGVHNAPLELNDQLKVCGALDLFSADSRWSPGRLVDYKATFNDYRLDQDQLKLYWLAMVKKGFKVGMSAFLLFRVKRKPVYHAFNQAELDYTTERFVDISKKIQREEFDFTPSPMVCKRCDLRNECPKAVLGEDAPASPKANPVARVLPSEVPEL